MANKSTQKTKRAGKTTSVAKKAPPAKKASTVKKPAAKVTVAKLPAAAKAAAPKKSSPAASKSPVKVPKVANVMDNFGTMGVAPYQEKSGEEYMNLKQRSHFREILLRWKQELMEEVDRTVHHMQDNAENFPDPNDRATQEEEFSLELRTRDRERKLIKKIDEALQKIEREEYGYCDACGIEIGIRRLEARPTATLCIDCKTLDEIREKQIGT